MRRRIARRLGTAVVAAALAVTGAAPAALAAPLPPAYYPGDYVVETSWGGEGSANGEFEVPAYIAADDAGNVYVADYLNDRVQKFGPTGAFLLQIGGPVPVGGTPAPGDLSRPYGVAVDRAGNVYVSDDRHQVQKFTASGAVVPSFVLGTPGTAGSGDDRLHDPRGVAVDAAGNVYVADNRNDRVQKFDENGDLLATLGGVAGPGELNDPNAVVVDARGSVYVTDAANDRVVKFAADGQYEWQWGGPGVGYGQLSWPEGIAVDAAGKVYVVDMYNFRVQKFDRNGGFIDVWGGGGPSPLSFPLGIAVGGSGRVYVSDTDLNKVIVYRQAAAAVLTAGPTAAATAGQAYSSQLAASGFPAVSKFARAAGSLPPGLTLSAQGKLSGTPSTVGTFTFTVSAENGVVPAATKSYTITVAPKLVAPTFTGSPSSKATVGKTYSSSVKASGTPKVTSFTVATGELPKGLKLTKSTGEITGTPSKAGTFTFSVKADNGVVPAATKSYTITVAPKPVAPAFTGSPSSKATVGKTYSSSVKASGTPKVASFTVVKGKLPKGLKLTKSTGKITGKPSKAGTYKFTVQASNGVAPEAKKQFTIKVAKKK